MKSNLFRFYFRWAENDTCAEASSATRIECIDFLGEVYVKDNLSKPRRVRIQIISVLIDFVTIVALNEGT